jgi:hypothetical protein
MRRSRHQQKVAGPAADQLSQLVPLGVFHFIPEQARRHPMSLVTDDKVPVRGGVQLGLQRLGSRRHVEPHDEAVAFDKRIAGNRELNLLA